MPTPPSPGELRAFTEEHLLYEVGMLADLTKRLQEVWAHDHAAGKCDLEWLDLQTRNALVEAFAMHARGLLDFFYATPPVREDDALAQHFVQGEWKPPQQTEALRGVKKRVNKEVAHLTYHRLLVTDAAKEWSYGQIWLAFGEIIRAFLDQASPDRLPASVARQVASHLPPPKNTLAGLLERKHFSALASATNSESAALVWEPPDVGKGPEISSDD
jgi:hypothetical protein